MTWDDTASTFQEYLASKVSLLPSTYLQFLEALSEGERLHQVSLLPIARLELYHMRWYKRVQYRHNLYALEHRRLIYK